MPDSSVLFHVIYITRRHLSIYLLVGQSSTTLRHKLLILHYFTCCSWQLTESSTTIATGTQPVRCRVCSWSLCSWSLWSGWLWFHISIWNINSELIHQRFYWEGLLPSISQGMASIVVTFMFFFNNPYICFYNSIYNWIFFNPLPTMWTNSQDWKFIVGHVCF